MGTLGKVDENLQKLDSSRLGIKPCDLTSDFSVFNCVILDLSWNKIDHVPEEFLSVLENIRELNLNGNSIKKLPVNFAKNLKDLQILHLSHNNIGELPNDFFQELWQLKSLFLSANLLTKFPTNVQTQLKALDISCNKLDVLNINSGDGLRELEYLDLSRNGIDNLPYQFAEWFPKLHWLNLSNNIIESLPGNFGTGLRNLEYLDLRGNKIGELPHDFAKWSFELQTLDLSGNRIISLPGHLFANLAKLQHVDLSCNMIAELPSDACEGLSHLQCLNMSNNSLTSLPEHFGHGFKKLEYLNLSQNEIKELPDGTAHWLQELQWLNLSGNKLKSLPEHFGAMLEKLRCLDASGNRIVELPVHFSNWFPELQLLNLSGNKLKFLPAHFCANSTNLEDLDLSKNRLVQLPSHFLSNSTELQSLNLSVNELKCLPKHFWVNLPKLEYLDMSKNGLDILSISSSDISTKLKYLNFSCNQFKWLPECFGKQLTKLEHFDLRQNKLAELPNHFSNWFPELKWLHLGDNELRYLPKKFGMGYGKLEYLNLSRNSIKNLPIYDQTWILNLETLVLSGNELETLPDIYVTDLTELKNLDISKNKISVLPDCFAEWLPQLQVLDISYNRLKSLPESFGADLMKLEYLDASFNDIKYLPAHLGMHLSRLQTLQLDNNKITHLPKSIAELKLDAKISILNNPLVEPPYEVCLQGLPAIKSYYNEEKANSASKPKNTNDLGYMDAKFYTNQCSQFYQSVTKKVLDENGGNFVFENLGVLLNLPKDALDSSLEIELSRKSFADIPLDLSFGECLLSDVVVLGPEDIALLKPCTLNIPYNLHERPAMTEVVAKHYVSSEEKWITLPTCLKTTSHDDEESVRKLAEVEITKAGIYTICLQLQPVLFHVDVGSIAVESYPFGEDTGIKLRFQPGTFAKNPAKCITKVNMLTDEATIALRKMGMITSPVLHIDMSEVPKRAITIELPFEQRESAEGKFVILQVNENGDFDDVTNDSKYELNENRVIFQVNHFSLFLAVRSKLSEFLEVLKIYVSGARDASFFLYGIKDEPKMSCCIACTIIENGERVNDWFKDRPYELIEKSLSKKGLYCGTKLKVDVTGSMKSNYDGELVLDFDDKKICLTDTFTLKESDEHRHEDPKDKNYMVLTGLEDCIRYGQIAYWRMLHVKGTGSNQAVIYNLNVHRHEHKHENVFNTNVLDGSTAIIGEANTVEMEDTKVLQIAYHAGQGRPLQIGNNELLEIEHKSATAISQEDIKVSDL